MELLEKETLKLNRTYKTHIKGIDYYENDKATTILIRCRSNTLKLNYSNRHTDRNTICITCETIQEETLEHFLLHCETYKEIRKKPKHSTREHTNQWWEYCKILLIADKQGINKKNKKFTTDVENKETERLVENSIK